MCRLQVAREARASGPSFALQSFECQPQELWKRKRALERRLDVGQAVALRAREPSLLISYSIYARSVWASRAERAKARQAFICGSRLGHYLTSAAAAAASAAASAATSLASLSTC